MGHRSRVQSPHGLEDMVTGQGQLAILPQLESREGSNGGQPSGAFLLTQFGTVAHRMVASTVRMGVPTAVNQF